MNANEAPAAGLPGVDAAEDRQDPGAAVERVPGAAVVGRVCWMTSEMPMGAYSRP